MADITIADLLGWVEGLILFPEHDASGASTIAEFLEREVSWVIAARKEPPILPSMRGGELVLLTNEITEAADMPLVRLVSTIASLAVSGIIVAGSVPENTLPRTPLLLLPSRRDPDELESELNRELTRRRGDIYRVGIELGRTISSALSAMSGVESLLPDVSRLLEMPVRLDSVRDAGVVLASGSAARDQETTVALKSGASLTLGPTAPEHRAIARMAAERIAEAVETITGRVSRERPRGAERASLLNRLIFDPPQPWDEQVPPMILQLGLSNVAPYRVVVASAMNSESTLARAFAPLGILTEAGSQHDAFVYLLAPRGEGRGLDLPERQVSRIAEHVPPDASIAISSSISGANELPAAGRQVSYLQRLFAGGLLETPVAVFDSVDQLGPYRLLYGLAGSPDLAKFANEVLGDFSTRDRRGELRRTLKIYLESGGSSVDAAAALGIHRNTLAYRLRQIGAMTGRSPIDSRQQLLLYLGITALDVSELHD